MIHPSPARLVLPPSSLRGRSWGALLFLAALVLFPPRLQAQEVAPPEQRAREKARPLAGRALENVAALVRLHGLLRFFHPSDQARGAPWNRLLVEGILRVEGCRDAEELATTLEAIHRPLAPTLRVRPTGRPIPLPAALKRPSHHWALGVIFHEHRGFAPGRTRGHFNSRRLIWNVKGPGLSPGAPDPRKALREDLPGGVSVLLATSLWTDNERTLPRKEKRTRPPSLPLPREALQDLSLRVTRVAATGLLWNVLQHFVVLPPERSTDFLGELRPWLAEAAGDPDPGIYLEKLRRRMAALQDGQLGVFHPLLRERAFAPAILWRVIEGALVITHVGRSVTGVRPGDVVLRVGGRPAATALADEEQRVSGSTPEHRLHFAALQLLLRRKSETLALTVKRADAENMSVRLPCERLGPIRPRECREGYEQRPAAIQEIRPKIFYVDLTRVNDFEFKDALEGMKGARGIVFDLRGKATGGTSEFALAHFSGRIMNSPTLLTPVIRDPDHRKWEWATGTWSVDPILPALQVPCVFLADERTVGSGEILLSFVKRYGLGKVVGGGSGGAAGLTMHVSLPGRVSLSLSGQRVKLPDGSFLRGRGFSPDLPAVPTISGIAEGRDEVIERAVDLLEKGG